MHVLIPAGGRGVRLRPLTSSCPKPLLPLGDRPILTRIVESLPPELPKTILVPPQLEGDFHRWQSTLPPRSNVRIYLEPAGQEGPAGPVSALAACVAESGIDASVLIMMGDSLLPFTLEQFLGGGGTCGPRLAAYELPDIAQATRFGVLEIDREGVVASFEEKPENPRSPWVFTGCLYLPQRLLSRLGAMAAGGLSQMGDVVAQYLDQGERIEVFRVQGEWHDIGTFESYVRAHRTLLTDGRRRDLLAQGNQLEGTVYVHPSARVEGCRLRDCVVFEEARVINTSLTRCVVQPRVAMVDRSVHGKLITGESELPV